MIARLGYTQLDFLECSCIYDIFSLLSTDVLLQPNPHKKKSLLHLSSKQSFTIIRFTSVI